MSQLAPVEVRGQLVVVGSFLPPCGWTLGVELKSSVLVAINSECWAILLFLLFVLTKSQLVAELASNL